jgi:hypothetical protein
MDPSMAPADLDGLVTALAAAFLEFSPPELRLVDALTVQEAAETGRRIARVLAARGGPA